MKRYFLIILIFIGPSVLFSQWFPASVGIVDSVSFTSCKFVNENIAYAVGSRGYIYKTTNSAASWFRQNSSSYGTLASVFFVTENTGWACGDNGILKTINGGGNWFMQFTPGVNFRGVYFVNRNTGMAVGIGGANIYKTTNGGTNWFSLTNPLPFSYFNSVFMVDTNIAYAVGKKVFYPPPIIKTTNGGTNWVLQTSGIPNNYELWGLSFIDGNTGIVGGVGGIIYYTSNGGNNWLMVPDTAGPVDIEHINENIVYEASCSAYIMKSTNGGWNWYPQLADSGRQIYSISFINEYMGIAVGSVSAVYKTTNGGGTIGIIKAAGNIPSAFKLYQNYPNPFNPVTKIKFDIRAESYVTMKLYDLNGRLLKVLIEQKLEAGTYETELNMNEHSSGLYFYVMETEKFKEGKKFILLK